MLAPVRHRIAPRPRCNVGVRSQIVDSYPRNPRRSPPALWARDKRERARASLTTRVSGWSARKGVAGSGIRAQRVLQTSLKDLEPPGRLGTPLDDQESRRGVEEASVQDRSGPLLAHRVGSAVGEDDVHSGESPMVVVGLHRASYRVGAAERWGDQLASG